MLPGFIFAYTQAFQQNLMARSLAARAVSEHNEEARKALFLQEKKKLIETVQKDSIVLAHEASVFPERTFVKAQLYLSLLDDYGVTPKSYEEQTQKENAILLWQKLLNIVEKSKSQMTMEQLGSCLDCLNAIAMQKFIYTIAERLEALENCNRMKPEIEKISRKSNRIEKYQKRSTATVTVVAVATFLIYTILAGFKEAISFLGLWIFIAYTIGCIFYLVMEFIKPKSVAKLEAIYQQCAREAQIGDTKFWQAVQDIFGGVPTIDRLTSSWEEQIKKIQPILGASSGVEGEAASQDGTIQSKPLPDK